MKKRILPLIILGVGALTLTSCGYGEISFDEFKAQLDKNAAKEKPNFTKGKKTSKVSNYKFECSNPDVGSIAQGALNLSIRALLASEGFDIPKDYDLSKGYSSTIDISSKEVEEITSVRYTSTLLPDDATANVKFFKKGDELKFSFVETEGKTTSSISSFIDGYGHEVGEEVDITISQDSMKLSLKYSTFVTLSK